MSFAALMYHSLSDGRFPDSAYPKYTTTLSLFREHMRFLLDEGFQIGAFADVLQRFEAGNDFPRKYCVVTIDDGHKSCMEMAEIMSDLKIRATFFLTMNYCRNRSDFLNDADTRQLSSAGFDFGTHGVTHRSLSHMPKGEMASELKDGKRWLEDVVGKTVQYMSLPAGQANRNVYECAYGAGYQLVGNSREQANHILRLPSALNRFVILAGYGCKEIQAIVSGSTAYVLKRRIRALILSVPKSIFRSYNAVRN